MLVWEVNGSNNFLKVTECVQVVQTQTRRDAIAYKSRGRLKHYRRLLHFCKRTSF